MANTILDNSHNDGAESRLSIHEVPEQISRIFFGKPEESYNQPYNPSYDSYGAPQAPAYQPGNNDFGYTGGSGYYANFYNDLELTMKIGQIALIAFILLVAVVVCFLLLMCCMYCPTLFGGGYRGQPQPETGGYYPTNIQVEPRNKHGGGDVWNEAIAEQTVSSSEGSSSTPTHQRAQTPKKLRRHKTGVLSPPANNNNER